MAKRGRPRSDRPRYPSGQVKAESAGITQTALHRLRRLGTSPILETEVGRLLFLGELDQIQAQTAWRIADTYGRYDRAMGRRRSAASPAYQAGRGRDTRLEESEEEIARSQAAVKRYNRLQDHIRAISPIGLASVLEELCVNDLACTGPALLTVKVALDRLSVALGLRGRRA